MLEIRAINSVSEADTSAEFFRQIWADGPEVVPMDLIVAGAHVDCYAFNAFEGEEIVGSSFGLRGSFRGRDVLHSHVTAATMKGVGYQLKQHQRQWAQDRNIGAITWTFDPLVRRNCYFNFGKLGATAVEYLENFYGSMPDAINAGEESDRFFTYWDISGSVPSEYRELARVTIPEDIENLRVTNLAEASRWRLAVRQELQSWFSRGCTVTGMSPDRSELIVSEKVVK